MKSLEFTKVRLMSRSPLQRDRHPALERNVVSSAAVIGLPLTLNDSGHF